MSAGPMMIIATLGVEPTHAARGGAVFVGSIGEGSIRVDRESWAQEVLGNVMTYDAWSPGCALPPLRKEGGRVSAHIDEFVGTWTGRNGKSVD
jgi:hypothetical protein